MTFAPPAWFPHAYVTGQRLHFDAPRIVRAAYDKCPLEGCDYSRGDMCAVTGCPARFPKSAPLAQDDSRVGVPLPAHPAVKIIPLHSSTYTQDGQ